jgi:uncharacterized protein (DUF1501 family)
MTTTALPSCCAEFERQSGLSRRSFLKRSAVVSGGLVATQVFGDALLQSAWGATTGSNVLVVLSLRGGIDGLGMVVPHGDPGYAAARPSTAVPKSTLVAADAMFGLHPKMAPLLPFWTSGELAAIQAVGLPVPNRSHFSAIEEVEDADPGSAIRSGWINRMIGLNTRSDDLEAVQIGDNILPSSLVGPENALAAESLDDLQVPGLDNPTRRYASLDTTWAGVPGPLGVAAREATAISKGPGAAVKAVPASTVTYPGAWPASDLADALKAAARLIRADVGTDVITIDYGSWDLHNNYGTVEWGMMQNLIDGFAGNLAAFLTDLGDLRSRVTIVTISEFGRRVAENGNKGFDHGWGNMMLVAGGGVKGGRYYGSWPGIGAAQLSDGDLKVTTDYRDVLGEVVNRRFPDRSIATLFPGLSYSPVGFMA